MIYGEWMLGTLGASLRTPDWVVLGAYFALLVVSGMWLSRRQKGTEDYFLAGRKMPAWAVAISVLASALSAATFLGAPQQAFEGDLTYLSANIGVLIAALIAAKWFIPAFYAHNVTTVYELLERRFGPGAKLAGSWMFLIGRVFASGARIYIAAHAVAFVAFGDIQTEHLLWAVAILTAVGIVYTIAGGIETVIWTDVVQTIVFLVAVVAAAVVLFGKIPIGAGAIADALGDAGKLAVVSTSTDLSKPFTLWTALGGLMLLNLAAFSMDHDLVQRMLTCKSAAKGSSSVIAATLLSLPVVVLFMVIGHLLWVFYARPDMMGAAAPMDAPTDSRKVLLHFITHEMPSGMSGLMIAGLFAIALGSLDSAINAMSATFVNDMYKPARRGRSEAHYLKVGRVGVVVFGGLLGAFAAVCVLWQHEWTPPGNNATFIDFALSVMTFAYSGLVGAFCTALFTKRGTSTSIVAGLGTGFIVVLLMRPEMLGALGAWCGVDVPKIAWPWAMLAASAASFVVCASVRGTKKRRA